MRRRVVLTAAGATLLMAFTRPESLAVRRAKFEEVGATVRMTLALPMLISARDKDAIKSIDSGFDTTLEFVLRAWEYGARQLVHQRMVTVKIRRDPWKKRYVVSTGAGANQAVRRRFFETREQAVAAATTLTRITVAPTALLRRGADGPYYFVEVLALRNPIEHVPGPRGRTSRRATGRDLEWFSRLVDVLVGERAEAEQTVQVRTNPFYLLPEES